MASEELIGRIATVVASAHEPWIGLSGRVVDETARTLVLDTGAREVRVPKAGQRFRFSDGSGSVEIDGAALAHHPVERLKRNARI